MWLSLQKCIPLCIIMWYLVTVEVFFVELIEWNSDFSNPWFSLLSVKYSNFNLFFELPNKVSILVSLRGWKNWDSTEAIRYLAPDYYEMMTINYHLAFRNWGQTIKSIITCSRILIKIPGNNFWDFLHSAVYIHSFVHWRILNISKLDNS